MIRLAQICSQPIRRPSSQGPGQSEVVSQNYGRRAEATHPFTKNHAAQNFPVRSRQAACDCGVAAGRESLSLRHMLRQYMVWAGRRTEVQQQPRGLQVSNGRAQGHHWDPKLGIGTGPNKTGATVQNSCEARCLHRLVASNSCRAVENYFARNYYPLASLGNARHRSMALPSRDLAPQSA